MCAARLKKNPRLAGWQTGAKYEIGVSNERAVIVRLTSRGSLGAPGKRGAARHITGRNLYFGAVRHIPKWRLGIKCHDEIHRRRVAKGPIELTSLSDYILRDIGVAQ
jgi:hypothetical protein